MLITRAFKFEIDPRPLQERQFVRCGHAAKRSWNWMLEKCETEYAQACQRATEAEDFRRNDEGELVLTKKGRKIPNAWRYHSFVQEVQRARDAATKADDWITITIKKGKDKGKENRVLNFKPYLDDPKRTTWEGRLSHAFNLYWRKELPWMDQIHSHAYGNAATRLVETYQRFFKGIREHQGRKVGKPHFKRRSDPLSFTIQVLPATPLLQRKRQLYIPMYGKSGDKKASRFVRVKTEDPQARIPKGAVPTSVTVSQVAGRWYCSVTCKNVKIPDPPKPDEGRVIGIDLGVNMAATIARSWIPGEVEEVPGPRALPRVLADIQRINRKLSLAQEYLRCDDCHQLILKPKSRGKKRAPYGRCSYGVTKEAGTISACGGKLRSWRSKRGQGLHLRVQDLNARAATIRANYLHNVTHRLVHERAVIVTEGHDIQELVSKGVAKTRRGKRKRERRREMMDTGTGELRRQLDYKSKWYGSLFVKTPKGCKTDTLCCECRHENKMPENTSEYRCIACGSVKTRQANTAWLLVSHGSGNPLPEPGPKAPDQPTAPEDLQLRTQDPAPAPNGSSEASPRNGRSGHNGASAHRASKKARKSRDGLPEIPRA